MSDKQSNYQKRMTKFVWISNIYGAICFCTLTYLKAPLTDWLVYLSAAVILYALAAGLDAVFDTLSERINVQSSWLDVRLSVLESKIDADSGQLAWRQIGTPTYDNSHYHYSYPEYIPERD